MKALDRPSRPYAICISSNLLANQGGKVMLCSSGLHRLEPVLISCGGDAIEDVCGTQIAVTTDSGHVEQEPSHETRRRLRERKTGPDGLDSKDAEGGAALGDPTSMRSWLSCLDILNALFATAVRDCFGTRTCSC